MTDGQAIAQLHAVTDGYPAGSAGFQFEPADMVDEPLLRLRPLFAEHQDDFDYLLEISVSLKQAAAKLTRKAPEYGIYHGDVNDGNLHLGEHGQWALLDFEYFGYGWRVFDSTVTSARCAPDRHEPGDTQQASRREFLNYPKIETRRKR